jgi:hypothetical protein
MRTGKVFKRKSSWWFSKESKSSIYVLSTKHKSKKTAMEKAWKELEDRRLEILHVWQANGKYDGCYSIFHKKGEQNV